MDSMEKMVDWCLGLILTEEITNFQRITITLPIWSITTFNHTNEKVGNRQAHWRREFLPNNLGRYVLLVETGTVRETET